MNTFIAGIFLTKRFYTLVASMAVGFAIAFFIPVIFVGIKILFAVLISLFVADCFFLFRRGKLVSAKRLVSKRLSNGDENEITITVTNGYNFEVQVLIIDEIPIQFQIRDFTLTMRLAAGETITSTYMLTPTQRGNFYFNDIQIYVSTGLKLATRRITVPAKNTVQVFPSFANFKKQQLKAIATSAAYSGNNKVRRIGQSMEFEQIKDYSIGDDIRNINWKATARKGLLMVNNYVDEKSQELYCVIDKGRLMKMPFGGLSLLDYAINSTLALTNISLQKKDKVGLISFGHSMGAMISADRNPIQRSLIMQALYKEETMFLESDFELLYTQIRHKIKKRSLIILFTNFETQHGLQRQLPYLRSIARHHLLLVIFFENTELSKLGTTAAATKTDIYVKAIAEKFVFEKKLLVKELYKYGITAMISTPEQLTVNAINKYLEIKAKQAV